VNFIAIDPELPWHGSRRSGGSTNWPPARNLEGTRPRLGDCFQGCHRIDWQAPVACRVARPPYEP
jgi:hypothetical protein